MILDSSAVLAILFQEGDAGIYAAAIEAATVSKMSAATYLELSIVTEGQDGKAGLHDLEEFIREAGIEIEPFTLEQARTASQAWSKYGKGRHSAALNFGDCFSYGLAKALDEPLLFKGTDFAKTDI